MKKSLFWGLNGGFRIKCRLYKRWFLAVAILIINVTAYRTIRAEFRYPFLNTELPVEERVADLLGRLTLDEKVLQMGNSSPEIPRLDIEQYQWCNECLHGVKGQGSGTMNYFSTVFPQAIGFASTWNPELIFKVATAISDEARAKYKWGENGLTFWSPMINIARDPRWGRTQEGYGEDPYLVSRIAVSFVKGLQGDHPKYLKLVSTPKHFALNNTDWNRHTSYSDIDERMLREYYLPHFKACVIEAKANAVMCAYNILNGVPCCGNKRLLTDILREEWGFDGHVVSDCGAIYDIYHSHKYVSTPEEAVAAAVKAGCDLNCGHPYIVYHKYLAKAVRDGLLSEETVDRALGRLLTSRFKLGMFDPPELVPFSKISYKVVNCDKHRNLALQTAREAIILLKNDNKILPLDKNIKSIAVIGPNANVCRFGNYSGIPAKSVTPLEGIETQTSKNTKVHYMEGCKLGDRLPAIPGKCFFLSGIDEEKNGLKAEYFSNPTLSGRPALVKTDKKVDFKWKRRSPARSISPEKFSVRWTGKLIPPVSKTFQLSLTTDDRMRLFINDKLIADVQYDEPTQLKDVLNHLVNVELNKGVSYDVRIEYFKKLQGPGIAVLGWNFITQGYSDIEKARKVAERADAVILFVGTDTSIAEEERDRSIMDLPGIQEDLVKEIYKVNPKTVVVLINGEPLTISWIKDNIPAIVEAWYPGEEGGNAIADVLFGNYNPAGRLPLTFYKSIDQLLPFNDYDILKGRTYMYFEEEVLFPFGHGLSYTEFEYSSLEINHKDRNNTEISMAVKNTGEISGDEVVQLYVHDVVSSVKRPIKELRRFERISLKPGEKKTIEFTLNERDLSFYDINQKKFVAEPGEFDVMIGSSSEDIRLSGSFSIK